MKVNGKSRICGDGVNLRIRIRIWGVGKRNIGMTETTRDEKILHYQKEKRGANACRQSHTRSRVSQRSVDQCIAQSENQQSCRFQSSIDRFPPTPSECTLVRFSKFIKIEWVSVSQISNCRKRKMLVYN